MRAWILGATILTSFTVAAKDASPEIKVFNLVCPAPRLLPKLEASYLSCTAGTSASCDEFVAIFRKLLPEYDCQRPYDSTPTARYVVPAIWLAGDPVLDRYLALLAQLKSKAARQLFASPEFRAVLDGDFAEMYRERSQSVERELKRK
jgi:hypothetical protein